MSLTQTTLKLALPLAISLALVGCGGSSSDSSSNSGVGFGTLANSSGETTDIDNTDTTTDDDTVADEDTTTDTETDENIDVASLIVYASSRTLLSDADADSATDGSEPVTIYMMAKDANNIALTGAVFTPSVDDGATLYPGTTSSDGILTTWLLVPDEPRNQTVNVSVTTGDITETLSIDIIGTSLQIDGAESISMDTPTTYTVKLKDAAGNGLALQPITITSDLLDTTLTTDSEGEAQFEVQPSTGGDYIIQAEALGSVSSKTINVSPNAFNLNADIEEIPVNTKQTIVLSWTADGAPQADKTIHLSATRGAITVDGIARNEVVTDSSGNASFEIESPTAGGTVVTATDNSTYLSTSLPLEYVATVPHYMNIQADPALIASLGTSTISAYIRDINDNPVKNKTVVFNLNDTVNGELSSSKATTDSSGHASVAYSAGQSSSAKDGVIITSHIEEMPDITDTTTLTVGGDAVRIVFGHDATLSENSPFYSQTLGVIVTDNAGNPVSNKTVNFTVKPIHYFKGYLEWKGKEWGRIDDHITCTSEDIDSDGQLDDGEDFNNSGTLEPTNATTITGNATTDESGTVTVDITYLQSHAEWNQIQLTAQVAVNGTEYIEKMEMTLEVSASDVSDESLAPPNAVSPYGIGPCASKY